MEKDVVCGMQVDPAKAAGRSEYNGKTHYFLLEGLRDEVRRQSRSVRQMSGPLAVLPVWTGPERRGGRRPVMEGGRLRHTAGGTK